MPKPATTLLDDIALAAHLRVTKKALANWRARGIGPTFVRVGRLIRYREEDIEAWLNARAMEMK